MNIAEAQTPARRDARVRALVVAALLVGLALRLAFAFGYWVGKPLTLDEQEYLLLASSVARGDGFTYPDAAAARTTRHFERPPVFAVLLAGVLRLTNDRLVSGPKRSDGVPAAFPRTSSEIPLAIRLLQALVGLCAVALVAGLAGRIAGPGGAVAGAAIAAVYPPIAWLSGYVLSEPLYSALALAVVWLLHVVPAGAARRVPAALATFAAGVLAGVAVLTKELMVFFLPFAAVWLLWRRGRIPALALAVGVALVLTPWIARNYAVHGRFVLTASHGGVTFWTGNNPLARGEGDLAANPEIGRARVAFEQRHQGLTPEALDRAYYEDAFRFITANPAGCALLLVKKLFYTVVPIGPSYRLHSPLYFLTTLFSYALVLACAVPGFAGLAARGRASHLTALWLLALSTVAACVVFFPQERFRTPVLDPMLLVCAAAWLASRTPVARLFPPAVQGRV